MTIMDYRSDNIKRVLVQSDFPLGPSRGWVRFFSILLDSNQIDFLDVNSTLPVQFSISFNHKDQHLKKIQDLNIPIENRILVMLECQAILPSMHRDEVLRQYGTIFSPSPMWASNYKTHKFVYPVLPDKYNASSLTVKKDIQIGIIQRNLYSCIKGEMYSFRREVIRQLVRKNVEFELRGFGWQKSTLANIFQHFRLLQFQIRNQNFTNLVFFPKHFRKLKISNAIPVENKLDFLSRVNVAIIIENSRDYVSEKIFDCFRTGTVPIYVGPDLELFGIPKNIVLTAPPEIDQLMALIDNLASIEISEYRSRAREFMINLSDPWVEEVSLVDLSRKISNIILGNELTN
jgi:hypothetical protein